MRAFFRGDARRSIGNAMVEREMLAALRRAREVRAMFHVRVYVILEAMTSRPRLRFVTVLRHDVDCAPHSARLFADL